VRLHSLHSCVFLVLCVSAFEDIKVLCYPEGGGSRFVENTGSNYQTTRGHISEDRNLNIAHRESSISQIAHKILVHVNSLNINLIF
jgi:hypothetical protein